MQWTANEAWYITIFLFLLSYFFMFFKKKFKTHLTWLFKNISDSDTKEICEESEQVLWGPLKKPKLSNTDFAW